MLIRRTRVAKSVDAAGLKPVVRRRVRAGSSPAPGTKFKGYTDAQGFQREGAPENWPFGMLKRSEILARKLRALLDKKEDEPALL